MGGEVLFVVWVPLLLSKIARRKFMAPPPPPEEDVGLETSVKESLPVFVSSATDARLLLLSNTLLLTGVCIVLRLGDELQWRRGDDGATTSSNAASCCCCCECEFKSSHSLSSLGGVNDGHSSSLFIIIVVVVVVVIAAVVMDSVVLFHVLCPSLSRPPPPIADTHTLG